MKNLQQQGKIDAVLSGSADTASYWRGLQACAVYRRSRIALGHAVSVSKLYALNKLLYYYYHHIIIKRYGLLWALISSTTILHC